jgi:hypothetical protein
MSETSWALIKTLEITLAVGSAGAFALVVTFVLCAQSNPEKDVQHRHDLFTPYEVSSSASGDSGGSHAQADASTPLTSPRT